MKYKPFKQLNRPKLLTNLTHLLLTLCSAPECRYISRKIFNPKLSEINFVWIFSGEIHVQSTQEDWENSKLYIIFLDANLDTGKPGIPKLGKFNQRYFHENYLKISLPILWGNLDSDYI